MEEPSPGQVVSPQGSASTPEPQPATPPVLPPSEPDDQPPDAAASPESSYAVTDTPVPPEAFTEDAITWTASEYIAHHKPTSWYALLALAGVVIATGAYFLTGGDIVSVVVIIFVVVVFGVYGARKPREQQYAISPNGLTIGPKTYLFSQFKSFAIIDEDAFASITFMPMQRFMPAISIYYDPQDEDVIVEVLSAYLPLETRGHDAVDRLMRKIRF